MKRSLLGAERLKKKGRVSRRASDEDDAHPAIVTI